MARYMVAEEFRGTKWYGFKTVRYVVARDHCIPMVCLTAVKTGVNLPRRALEISLLCKVVHTYQNASVCRDSPHDGLRYK